MLLALLVLSLMACILAVALVARPAAGRIGARVRPRRSPHRPAIDYDPGRERRAEQRARQLLRSCVNDEEWGMYRDLGFIRVAGRRRPGGRRGSDGRAEDGRADGRAGDRGVTVAPYAYLVYPHKPIVAYVPETGQLLSEYCVEFPDLTGDGRSRLPASDDVLAKWMALTSDESRVIGRANMHLVGRQHDPARVRRDLWRLSEWDRGGGAAGRLEARHT